jgi:hypothetical protein
VIDRAMERDPTAARSEYLALFRSDDATSYIGRDLLRAATDVGVTSRPPAPGLRYAAFVDASSGRSDSFAAAIGHAEGDLIVLDHLFEKKPPFDASQTVAEVAALLKVYRVFEVQGDRYSIGFLESEFGRSGIRYLPAELDRSELFLSALPLLTSHRVRLLDNARLIEQFAQLERRIGSTGRDSVTHPRSGHDDVANACAGCLVAASTRRTLNISPELLQRVAAMPVNPRFQHTAWGFNKRAALAHMLIPKSQQGYPASMSARFRQPTSEEGD